MDPDTQVAAEIVETVAEAIEEAANNEGDNISDNEVEIARIEADKEITIAAIHADAQVATAEAYNEPAQESNIEWTMEQMRAELTELRLEVASISERQSQQTSLVSEAVEMVTPETVEAIAETLQEVENLTPQSTSQETSETLMEAIQESAGEGLELPPILEIRKPMIRLV
jgi:hypothetical protein